MREMSFITIKVPCYFRVFIWGRQMHVLDIEGDMSPASPHKIYTYDMKPCFLVKFHVYKLLADQSI